MNRKKTHTNIDLAYRYDSFLYSDLARSQWGRSLTLCGKEIACSAVRNHFDTSNLRPRIYFLCPCCGRRVRYLYSWNARGEGLRCRICGRFYYPSQQVTHGRKEEYLRMKKILDAMGYYECSKLSPFCMACLDVGDLPRPMHLSEEVFHKYLERYHNASDAWADLWEQKCLGYIKFCDKLHRNSPTDQTRPHRSKKL